jgi:hypothetical protein
MNKNNLKNMQEKKFLPIIIPTRKYGEREENHPPFLITLVINKFCIHNCQVNLRASTNVMRFKFMKKIGLEISQAYENTYKIDSRIVPVYGII